MKKVKIIVAGPRGRMGQEAVKMVQETEEFELVSVLDHKNDGMLLSEIDGFSNINVPIYTNIEECLQKSNADVLVDLTIPESGYIHTKTAILYGVRPVVGTTGFTKEQLEELTDLAAEKEIGCIIAPNFAIGAVLMMKFSQMASKFFPDVEIIELHHDQKLDAPSGTAVKTAQMISEYRQKKEQGHPNEKETMSGARGANMDGMHIHSVRLPGLIAHQQVLFGADGQTLTIRHDSYNRASFMSGVKVSIETVLNLSTLVYGLENILD
ncbi:4-hydroxy-tetrahydrodipicolinate reductase [Heyndrickxia shackletonii]|uniref:4-hydroxy-tetrahydrodipicolinate reductase n=1 Tax=Heyndrickxia shackletonii TaxID=157838 RepID=A0A0Q3WVF5_9BACI|nr:4-hydroxy-tetrahydrodipicolinate reductase [Heyndrickxia shackletonii]KQL53723.1 4-hydroxy-tetrahydrodipicolinate reductase [Heyndrickxia shackletonii]MBB2481679.1 4-hydroxy-tetrahydrodipicolinate reductase [Bacillus sp. APMAM]NEY99863.1 4-hydroxy-tetrahydrodipicolinate reductase [Heyndrickxia shackletonii]RTZ54969.1 4-hydroxy-tetrahydrodipicolinate reductase [Bacillus sp. SAJ1]